MHQNSLKISQLFLILLNDGWMVDLAMGSFGFLTIFLIFWHPWDPWICICSVCWKWNLKRIEAIPPSVLHLILDIRLQICIGIVSIQFVKHKSSCEFADYFFGNKDYSKCSKLVAVVCNILRIGQVINHVTKDLYQVQ